MVQVKLFDCNDKTENIFSLAKSVVNMTNNTSAKLLRIHLDSQLSLNIHIDNLCQLRKLKGCITNYMLVTSYYAFCQLSFTLDIQTNAMG